MNELLPLPSGIAPLPHWGVIRVEGDDAARFIHSQLTQDFSLLGPDQARLAAFCSAKGRMLASFVGIKPQETEILLLCSRDILPATLKRLSMFVMRAKAKLSDASDQFLLCGLTGSATIGGGHESSESPAPWQVLRDGQATAIQLYPAVAGEHSIARQLWLAPLGTALPVTDTLAAELWAWGEVVSGIAMISQPVSEAFVPQMLNYESVGGVNFKKGCYPGQEVVARSQFRGTLKRRAFVVSATARPEPGQEVFGADDATQPVGMVVQSAADPEGGFVAIVSSQVAAAEAGSLQLGGNGGPILKLLPLPYQLLEDL